jgi:gliding motility-associated-like protein
MNRSKTIPATPFLNRRKICRDVLLLFCGLLITFSYFGQSYFLNGTATLLGEDCYQLTTTQPNQNGTVWYEDLMDLSSPFELSFTMNFGTSDSNGADGMVFVLQNVGTSALGQSGGALGFSGFDPSFGIEFDTWNNGEYGDMIQDHIGFVSDGSVNHNPPTGLGGPIQASLNSLNIEDGEDHPVKITWDPGTQIIAVYFDCDLRLAEQVDLIDNIFSGETLVYWGFTGGTGGSYNNQSVCLSENIIATGPETVICPGASVELNVVGAPNSTFTWSPPTFLTDPDQATTLCTPDSSMLYTVTYEGFCDALITDSVFVLVTPLEASAFATPSYTLTCNTPELQLSGSSNFLDGIAYNWESDANGNIIETLGPNATVDSPGSYTLFVESEDGICTDETSLEIFSDFSTFDVTLIASEIQLDCNTGSLEIEASSDASAILDWSLPANANWTWIDESNVIEISTSGLWGVVSTNPANGCTEEAEIEIFSDFTQPILSAGEADTITCASPASSISDIFASPDTYSPVYEWSWNTEGSLNDLDPLNPIAYQPGWYQLQVTFEENGCTSIDSVFVFQDPEAFVDASSATLPNIISPNGDGQNERFRPFLSDDPNFPLLSIVDQYQLNIYNRWGNAIYEYEGGPVEWDGRFNGELATEGVYYVKISYLILCGGEQSGTLQGELHLVR